MAEYRLSPLAEADLEAIWRYTADKWGVSQANLYQDTLTTAFIRLAAAPQTAPSCDHIRPGYRCSFVEQHTIYFRTAKHGISIVRILHQRMDTVRLL
ncbi:MAG: type II toxin-antitoxin system RelE/ParE family toxin [Gammaproteobacteria bacterium]|nr:type II toxin-antitoxin system RelE/ParE family toxin [Gammaproteobacteria bacterium]